MTKNSRDDQRAPDRPRLKKETLRGLGFAELEQVCGGDNDHQVLGKPGASRRCLEPVTR